MSDTKWYELIVKAPLGNATPQTMKRVDEHVNQYGAVFNAPDGVPIQNMDGSFDLRIYSKASLGFVKYILTNHYGLEIVKEVEHDE